MRPPRSTGSPCRARLEDDAAWDALRESGEVVADAEHQVVDLDNAGAGDEEQTAPREGGSAHAAPDATRRVAARRAAAATKAAKRGWGRVGRDLSSGWN
ncbi:MAG: hypothetical protein RI891_1148 [Gemmatimonadota bacterium]